VNDDAIYIQAVITGDNEAYRSLVQKYEVEMSRLMWRFTRDQAVCERLVQDVFVEAFFNLKSYRGKAPFIQWLKTIGTRIGYRFWKEQNKSMQCISLWDEQCGTLTSHKPMLPCETAEIVHLLLARLSVSDRLVLTLMYFDHCDTAEIARRMGWSRAAVKMRAMRARNRLRKIAENGSFLEKLGWIS
jgi:RNA polymerase sigma-70 factor (ECF subfamily)